MKFLLEKSLAAARSSDRANIFTRNRILSNYYSPQDRTRQEGCCGFSIPRSFIGLPTPSEILDKNAGVGAILDLGVHASTKVDLAFAGSATSVVHASSIPYNTSKKDINEVNTPVFTRSRAGTAIATTSITVPDR